MTSPTDEPSRTTGSGSDGGLLCPVGAGSAVEAATDDRAFLHALLEAELALARTQHALGQAPASAVETLTAVARADRFDPRDLALRARAAGNPVVPLVTDLTDMVRRADPDAAEHVHRGATSQDILDTALMLLADRSLHLIGNELTRVAETLTTLAAEHRATPMAGRTLTQHAVPTTFGLKAAGWRGVTLDARDRLVALRQDRLPAQLGGAAGTLAAFLADPGHADPARDRIAEQAGGLLARFAAEVRLAEPALPWHTLRTPVAELAGGLALCTGALGKIAADVLVLTRTEIGELAEASGGPSSAMPHKANPVRATLVVSAARQAPALAGSLYAGLVAEDERPAGAWHAEWQPLRELLRLAGGAATHAAELLAGLRVFPERMAANLRLTGGLPTSERCTHTLSPLLGRRRAAETVTAAVHRGTTEGVPLHAALATDPSVAAVLTPERLAELTDPAANLGAAPELTDRALLRDPYRPASTSDTTDPRGTQAGTTDPGATA